MPPAPEAGGASEVIVDPHPVVSPLPADRPKMMTANLYFDMEDPSSIGSARTRAQKANPITSFS